MSERAKAILAVFLCALLVAAGVWISQRNQRVMTTAPPGTPEARTTASQGTMGRTTVQATTTSAAGGVVSLQIPVGAAVVIGVAVVASFVLIVRGLVRRAARRAADEAYRHLQVELQEAREKGAQEERVRIERELHDGLQKEVQMAKIRLQTLEESPELAAEFIPRLTDDHGRIVQQLQAVVHGADLAPSRLQEEIEQAASDLREAGILVFRTIWGEPRVLPHELRHNVAMIVREAFTNVMKHASRDARVLVFLHFGPDQIELEIVDTGRGFDIEGVAEGSGLQGMRERASELGGKLEIQSEEGIGTTVRIEAPYEKGVSVENPDLR